MSKTLVYGATGGQGAAGVEELLGCGAKVRILSLQPTKSCGI